MGSEISVMLTICGVVILLCAFLCKITSRPFSATAKQVSVYEWLEKDVQDLGWPLKDMQQLETICNQYQEICGTGSTAGEILKLYLKIKPFTSDRVLPQFQEDLESAKSGTCAQDVGSRYIDYPCFLSHKRSHKI